MSVSVVASQEEVAALEGAVYPGGLEASGHVYFESRPADTQPDWDSTPNTCEFANPCSGRGSPPVEVDGRVVEAGGPCNSGVSDLVGVDADEATQKYVKRGVLNRKSIVAHGGGVPLSSWCAADWLPDDSTQEYGPSGVLDPHCTAAAGCGEFISSQCAADRPPAFVAITKTVAETGCRTTVAASTGDHDRASVRLSQKDGIRESPPTDAYVTPASKDIDTRCNSSGFATASSGDAHVHPTPERSEKETAAVCHGGGQTATPETSVISKSIPTVPLGGPIGPVNPNRVWALEISESLSASGIYLVCGEFGDCPLFRRLRHEADPTYLYFHGEGDIDFAGWYVAGLPRNLDSGRCDDYEECWRTLCCLPVLGEGEYGARMKAIPHNDPVVVAALAELPERCQHRIRAWLHASVDENISVNQASASGQAEAGQVEFTRGGADEVPVQSAGRESSVLSTEHAHRTTINETVSEYLGVAVSQIETADRTPREGMTSSNESIPAAQKDRRLSDVSCTQAANEDELAEAVPAWLEMSPFHDITPLHEAASVVQADALPEEQVGVDTRCHHAVCGEGVEETADMVMQQSHAIVVSSCEDSSLGLNANREEDCQGLVGIECRIAEEGSAAESVDGHGASGSRRRAIDTDVARCAEVAEADLDKALLSVNTPVAEAAAQHSGSFCETSQRVGAEPIETPVTTRDFAADERGERNTTRLSSACSDLSSDLIADAQTHGYCEDGHGERETDDVAGQKLVVGSVNDFQVDGERRKCSRRAADTEGEIGGKALNSRISTLLAMLCSTSREDIELPNGNTEQGRSASSVSSSLQGRSSQQACADLALALLSSGSPSAEAMRQHALDGEGERSASARVRVSEREHAQSGADTCSDRALAMSTSSAAGEVLDNAVMDRENRATGAESNRADRRESDRPEVTDIHEADESRENSGETVCYGSGSHQGTDTAFANSAGDLTVIPNTRSAPTDAILTEINAQGCVEGASVEEVASSSEAAKAGGDAGSPALSAGCIDLDVDVALPTRRPSCDGDMAASNTANVNVLSPARRRLSAAHAGADVRLFDMLGAVRRHDKSLRAQPLRTECGDAEVDQTLDLLMELGAGDWPMPADEAGGSRLARLRSHGNAVAAQSRLGPGGDLPSSAGLAESAPSKRARLESVDNSSQPRLPSPCPPPSLPPSQSSMQLLAVAPATSSSPPEPPPAAWTPAPPQIPITASATAEAATERSPSPPLKSNVPSAAPKGDAASCCPTGAHSNHEGDEGSTDADLGLVREVVGWLLEDVYKRHCDPVQASLRVDTLLGKYRNGELALLAAVLVKYLACSPKEGKRTRGKIKKQTEGRMDAKGHMAAVIAGAEQAVAYGELLHRFHTHFGFAEDVCTSVAEEMPLSKNSGLLGIFLWKVCVVLEELRARRRVGPRSVAGGVVDDGGGSAASTPYSGTSAQACSSSLTQQSKRLCSPRRQDAKAENKRRRHTY